MNGYQQRINYFYPDHNGHLNSAQYLSDMFKLNGIDTEGSYDLDDTVSYPGVQGIWVLSGIVDGAPPCSMNWHVWDSTTALNYHGPEPTAMEIVSEQDSAVTTTSSFDDEWSVGYNFDFSAPGKEKSARLTASVEMKYMGAYQKEIQNKTTWKKTVATTSGLPEETQEMGSYIWTVPELTRYRYDAYPWWEPRTTTQYAIPNSTMFLFRTTGTVTSVIPTNLDGYPWYITDPNSATLSSWKNGGSRDSIFNQTHQYGFAPIFNLSWTSPENGGADRYLTSAGTTTKCSFTNGFEVKAGIGMKVPDVFKGSVSGSEAAKWTNSVETETEFGSEISANLSELSSQSMGTNISKLQFDVYWLYLDSLDDGGGHYEYTNWWYWSRFNGMKPFYIGYRVNTVRAGITLESPADKTCFANNEIWFNWTADGEPLDNFTVYIAKSCNFNPSSIIWKQKTDNNRAVAAADFKPEPGKTYYWRVSGEGGTGEWIWSHIRSFTIAKPADTLINEISLRVIVYPNPGKNNEVKLSFQAKESGDVIYSVFEASGRMVYTATITYPGNNTATFIPLPTGLKPGVYLTEIRSQGERVLKKLVILY